MEEKSGGNSLNGGERSLSVGWARERETDWRTGRVGKRERDSLSHSLSIGKVVGIRSVFMSRSHAKNLALDRRSRDVTVIRQIPHSGWAFGLKRSNVSVRPA